MSELKDYIQFNKIQIEVLKELIKSIKILGAKSDLVSSLSSWGDCQTDKETLSNIKAWNESNNTKQ